MRLIRSQDIENITQANRAEDFTVSSALAIVEAESLNKFDPVLIQDIKALDRESESDQAKELYKFWKNDLRHYLSWKVSEQIVLTQGVQITRSGVIIFSDSEGNTESATDTQRKRLLTVCERLGVTYLTKTLSALEAAGYKFDGKTYDKPKQAREIETGETMGMTPVGRLNYKQRRL